MLQLQIEHCDRDAIDALHLALDETNALSVTLTDKHDDPILEPELGTTPLWPNIVVEALYAETEDAKMALQYLTTQFPELTCRLQELPDQDWERVCMADFKPQQFGERLWICPSWLTPPVADAVTLILDPGLAFGTGTHPTTALCLTWLEQASLDRKTVIDYGCGSGILALAALKLGAFHVHAVDIDEQALLATQNNAETNLLSSTQLTISFPDQLDAPVDLLIANILLTPLLALKPRFRSLLKQGGTLVVSGLLKEQVPELISTYQDLFTHQHTLIQGDWALVSFTGIQ